MRKLCIAAFLIAIAHGAVVVDRIAVIAGKRLIKLSDIDREVRLTSFLNGQAADFSGKARRAAAERLVDQQIIRQELVAQGYERAGDQDAAAFQSQMVRDRFRGSAAELRAGLQKYGISENEFHEQLVWQLTVLQFIEARFRPGVLVTDEEVAAYYQAHLADIRRESPKDFRLETVAEKIKTTLAGQRIDQEFEAWLTEAKKQNRIEYREAAFR